MAKTRDPENEIVKKNLRRFRDEADLTTEQAAVLASVPIDSLRRYEAGKSGVPGKVLRKLGMLYGHAMEDFYLEKPPKADVQSRPAYALMPVPGANVEPAEWEAFVRKVAEIASKTMRSKTRQDSK